MAFYGDRLPSRDHSLLTEIVMVLKAYSQRLHSFLMKVAQPLANRLMTMTFYLDQDISSCAYRYKYSLKWDVLLQQMATVCQYKLYIYIYVYADVYVYMNIYISQSDVHWCIVKCSVQNDSNYI